MIKIGSLFAGIGGFELGLERAIPGSKTVWQVEQERFCQKILRKHWPDANIYDDVRAVGAHNLEQVDIICGGFPCQDISNAGLGRGLDGEKSSLWFEMLRVICELRPRVAVMENVPAITFRGLPRILGGLSAAGYDSEWKIISARETGAFHLRKRMFVVAYSSGQRLERCKNQEITRILGPWREEQFTRLLSSQWKLGIPTKSNSGIHDGIPGRMDRLKALGNAIVPQCSELLGRYIFNSGLLS